MILIGLFPWQTQWFKVQHATQAKPIRILHQHWNRDSGRNVCFLFSGVPKLRLSAVMSIRKSRRGWCQHKKGRKHKQRWYMGAGERIPGCMGALGLVSEALIPTALPSVLWTTSSCPVMWPCFNFGSHHFKEPQLITGQNHLVCRETIKRKLSFVVVVVAVH